MFLLGNTSIDITLKMFFFTFWDLNTQFAKKGLFKKVI